MHEIGILIDVRPRSVFVFEVFHSKLDIRGCPMWLNRRDVGTNHPRAGIVFGDYISIID